MTDVDNGAVAALRALQEFSPGDIAGTDTLGKAFDFTSSIPMVESIVDFFRLLPLERVLVLPVQQRNQVLSLADVCWSSFQAMLRFDPKSHQNPASERTGLVARLEANFNDLVQQVGPTLAFVNAQARDTGAIEREAQEALHSVKASASEVDGMKAAITHEASRILNEVRQVAAEAGVSQQAIEFGQQAETHNTLASKWQTYTNWMAAGLIAFALASWGVSLWIVPKDPYQAAQMAISKLLIFSTLAYLLFLCGRTLMAHRHNEVVNRHRQNALLTFNALTDAAESHQTKEIVLTHASSCIYAPQDSGFSKAGSSNSGQSLIEIVPKIANGSHVGAAS